LLSRCGDSRCPGNARPAFLRADLRCQPLCRGNQHRRRHDALQRQRADRRFDRCAKAHLSVARSAAGGAKRGRPAASAGWRKPHARSKLLDRFAGIAGCVRTRRCAFRSHRSVCAIKRQPLVRFRRPSRVVGPSLFATSPRVRNEICLRVARLIGALDRVEWSCFLQYIERNYERNTKTIFPGCGEVERGVFRHRAIAARSFSKQCRAGGERNRKCKAWPRA
jgi:hypothetical protein